MDAVRENAEWCDLVARADGIETGRTGELWWAARRTPEFFPDAVTLAPDVPADRVLAHIDASPGASVKDSFATLDLTPYGFHVLFAAQWITCPPPADPVSDWVPAAGGLRHPDVAVLTSPDGTARVTAHRSGRVVGLSNLRTGSHGWPEALAAVSSAFPGRTVVGYERPDDLAPAIAAGFVTAGPLRVWLRA
jgi:hypothetical protein